MTVFLSRSELELKLLKMEEEQAVKEANLRENVKLLTKDNEKLLNLSAERMQTIQVKGTPTRSQMDSDFKSLVSILRRKTKKSKSSGGNGNRRGKAD